MNTTISNGLYIAPIRKLDPITKRSLLQYTDTKEIVESSNININTISAETIFIKGQNIGSVKSLPNNEYF